MRVARRVFDEMPDRYLGWGKKRVREGVCTSSMRAAIGCVRFTRLARRAESFP